MTEEALERLGQLLNIIPLGGEDWDLMFADPSRIEEFCATYQKFQLSADAKTALMALIVASLDRYLSERELSGDLKDKITELIRNDFPLHRHTVEYWSKLKAPNPDRLWAVSPLMRQILRENNDFA
jgi:hypothetical protein